MIYKITLKVVAVSAYFYMCGLMFNHFNAWIGIGGVVLGVIFLIDRLIKYLKNKEHL